MKAIDQDRSPPSTDSVVVQRIAPLLFAAFAACQPAVGTAPSDAGQTDGGCSGTPTDGSGACVCGGFIMPNPASAGLPHAASYQDNGDGTITDRITGFLWDRSASTSTTTHAQALDYCAGRGGRWRLPTRIELVSLVDFTVPQQGPTINPAFPDTPQTVFWTSSPDLHDPNSAWGVFFDIGYSDYDDVSDAGHARCVSVPDAAIRCYPSRYVVSGASDVSDVATGLTWQKNAAPMTYTWADAKSFCAGLGGSWRLPSMTELQTLVDDRQSPSTIDPQAFPNTPAEVFWTSSPVAGQIYAWGIDFSTGSTTNPDLTATNGVRCVH
jgi:Protein of unknown function (DUF1566)